MLRSSCRYLFQFLHLLDHGAYLRTIQEMLGHVTIASTEIYTHVTNHHLKDTTRKVHPLAYSQNNVH